MIPPLAPSVLVRLDLASTAARELGLRCTARVLVDLCDRGTDELWREVAEDFARHGTINPLLSRRCAEAARCMLADDVNGAIEVLATYCGLSADAWLEATREEQEGLR